MTAVDGSAAWTYTYNADGLRLSRTDGTTEYNYVYLGGQLVYMTIGDSVTMKFNYDANGAPVAVQYNGTTYYYITNLQGDIVGIVNQAGTRIISYTYDAWGNILTIDGTMANTLGALNPIRYRGYVYDQETGLYYLQSRYYDPEVGRFTNADSLASTGQGFCGNNMFAYCLNNPISYHDGSGEDAIWLQEEGNVYTMGHSGLLIYNEQTEKWYYFFWGMSTTGENARCYLIEVDLEGADPNNIDAIVQAIDNALSKLDDVDEEFRETRSKITGMVYFEGDFSSTYSYLYDLSVDENAKYDLFTFNCGQVCWEAMSKTDVRFRMTNGYAIPNLAYSEILIFKELSPFAYGYFLFCRGVAMMSAGYVLLLN